MTISLSPFVYWAQSETNIFLKVDLKDVKDAHVQIDKRKLNFEGKGLGAKGYHTYAFSIDLQSDIDTEDSTYKIYDNKIDFNITKDEKCFWPRLTSQPQKPVWLKIDFDRWQSEDIEDEDEVRDIRQDYPDLYQQLQKDEIGYKKEDLKKVYLVLYNIVMYVGFFYVCAVLGIRLLKEGQDSFPTTYEAVGTVMCFLQMLQFLEVLHPLFGYTKGSVLLPFLQTMGRAVVLVGLIDSEPRMQTKPLVFYLFLVWSSIEIVRYPYYLNQLYKMEQGLLKWLRYTMWIPLYPLGFLCEGVVILRSIPYFEETGRFTIALPNQLNFSFHFPSVLRVYLLFVLLPAGSFMMSNMYKIREKKLGSKNMQRSKTH